MQTLQITGFSQSSLSISSTGEHTSALERGYYVIWSNVDCYIKTNTAASDVTTSTGLLLYANQMPGPFLIEPNHKIGAITSGAAGTLYYHRVS